MYFGSCETARYCKRMDLPCHPQMWYPQFIKLEHYGISPPWSIGPDSSIRSRERGLVHSDGVKSEGADRMISRSSKQDQRSAVGLVTGASIRGPHIQLRARLANSRPYARKD